MERRELLCLSSSWTSNVPSSSGVLKYAFYCKYSGGILSYAISIDSLVSFPPFVLFLIVFLYQYFLFYPSLHRGRRNLISDGSILLLSSFLSTHASLPYCRAGLAII
jgi:hypothetical protein